MKLIKNKYDIMQAAQIIIPSSVATRYKDRYGNLNRDTGTPCLRPSIPKHSATLHCSSLGYIN